MAHIIRLLIADDSARVRSGLCALLKLHPDIEIVGEATNGQDAVQLIATCQPEIVLMDAHMPILDGIVATQIIKQTYPMVMVVVLTMYAGDQYAAMQAGADAFLIKASTLEQLLFTLGLAAIGNP